MFEEEDENELMKQLKGRCVLVQLQQCHSQCLPPYISTVFRCDRLAFPSVYVEHNVSSLLLVAKIHSCI